MSKPLLHLDADTSIKALHLALLNQGHDVTRTPTDWMPLDATDETQLLGATARRRCIFTIKGSYAEGTRQEERSMNENLHLQGLEPQFKRRIVSSRVQRLALRSRSIPRF
ncbi:MAG: hypothetical protein V7L21_02870 [Nostoc sp.]|uniref:hypothetical protein n=1 Tax=Nostoc sp. TaxID=1180 RepID=UPI002FF93BC0